MHVLVSIGEAMQSPRSTPAGGYALFPPAPQLKSMARGQSGRRQLHGSPILAPPLRRPRTEKQIRGRMSAVPTSNTKSSELEDRIFERVSQRGWPILVSVAYFGLALAYWFRWGSIVRHTPSLWLAPGDLWTTYQASGRLAHGHFGSIYGSGLVTLPGMALVLAPLAAHAFASTLVEISNHGHPYVGLQYLVVHGTPVSSNLVSVGSKVYAVHPQAFIFVGPVTLVLSCLALFALDALAQRLQVSRWRRALLTVVEAVLLWNVTVIYGHPEDAVAVALATYALIFALDGRFTGAGWLFGAALAVQPLVIVVFPLLIVLGGRSHALGWLLRAVIPAAAVTIAPLASDANATVHALVSQPISPIWRAPIKPCGRSWLRSSVAAASMRRSAVDRYGPSRWRWRLGSDGGRCAGGRNRR